jgi:hypothetical protein
MGHLVIAKAHSPTPSTFNFFNFQLLQPSLKIITPNHLNRIPSKYPPHHNPSRHPRSFFQLFNFQLIQPQPSNFQPPTKNHKPKTSTFSNLQPPTSNFSNPQLNPKP